MLTIIGYAEDLRNRDRVSIKFQPFWIKGEAGTFGEIEDRQTVAHINQPILPPFSISDKWNALIKQPTAFKKDINDSYQELIPFPDGWVGGINTPYIIRDSSSGIYVKQKFSAFVRDSNVNDYYPDGLSISDTVSLGSTSATSDPISVPDYELSDSFSSYAFQDKYIQPVVTKRFFTIIPQYKEEPEYYREENVYLGIARSLLASSYEPKKSYSYEIKCEIGRKAVIYSIPEGTDAHIVDLLGLPYSCITKDGRQVVVNVNFSTPLLAIIKTSDDLEVKVRIVPYYSWRRESLDKVR